MRIHPFLKAFLAFVFILASASELEQRTNWTISLVLFIIGIVLTISFVKELEKEQLN